MIRISFTNPNELDISSSPENFGKLRETLTELLESSRDEMVVCAETGFDPTPYNCILPKLVIRKAEGPTLVRVTDSNALFISGSVKALDAFASYIDFDKTAKFPDHCHFEYYDGHPVIHPNSIPIVFSVAKDDELAA